MAELSFKHRLQPSLIDRLTDDAPEELEETRETRGLSEPQLREHIRRGLASLFNTTQLGASRDLARFPEACGSTLNYGIADLAGLTLSSVDMEQLTRTLREAVERFEPRLLPSSLTSRPHIDRGSHGRNAIVFDIEAELWSQPLPISLHLRSEIDLESGAVEIDEQRTLERGER